MAKQEKLPKQQEDLPLPEKETPAHAQTKTSFKSKWLFPLVLVVILIVGLCGYILFQNNATNQVACPQDAKQCPDGSYVGRVGPHCAFGTCPAPTQTTDETINWKTYTHSSLPFSVKYPSDVLTPSFKNIDPEALKNRLISLSSDIDQYVESKYYGNGIDGFDDSDNTDLGSLIPQSDYIPNSTYSYRGIRFSQYYLGNKDISALVPYFRNNKGFSTTQINGVKVGVFDGTTKITGIPPAYVKTYYFKMGEYVLSVGTFIFASAAPLDKSKIFTLFDNLAKTIKIYNQPITTKPETPTNTQTPTPVPFGIKNIDPTYLPRNYDSLGKNHMTVNGSRFQRGATVRINGPYDLQSGAPLNGQAIDDVALTNVIYTPDTKLYGTIPAGLQNGYFKIIVTNPDGSSVSTGLSLLRGNDPNEK